jgi:hypothetical protein
MDFLNDIPIWVYAVVGGVGLVLGAVLIFLHVRAAPPPGARSKGATPQLIFGIISLLLLGLVPLVLMIIALTQDDGRDRKRDRNRDRDRDRVEEDRSDRREGPGDTTWQVEFTAEDLVYRGQFEPRDGRGPLKLIFGNGAEEVRVRQDCTLEGEREVRITCRDPRLLSGGASYSPDNFELRWDGEDEMTGRIISTGSGTARFRRGSDRRYTGSEWEGPGRVPTPYTGPDTTTAPPAPGGDLAARLSAAAAQQRSRLPIRSGPTTITAIDVSGTNLNLWVQINGDLNATQWSQLDQVLRTQTCGGSMGNLIRQGASVGYQMVDSGQEQRSLSVTSC